MGVGGGFWDWEQEAEQRDRAAEQRDEDAVARDDLADGRDRASDRGDEQASDRERAQRPPPSLSRSPRRVSLSSSSGATGS